MMGVGKGGWGMGLNMKLNNSILSAFFLYITIGTADRVVNYAIGEMTKGAMKGYYVNLKFNSYNSLGHTSNAKV